MGQYCSQVLEESSPFRSLRGTGAGGGGKVPQRPRALLSWQRDSGVPQPRAGVTSSTATFAASQNPADYTAAGLSGMRWQRLPGQVNDQRINIDRCSQCQVFLLDQCDSVQIDECQQCVFFIGPTSGSVFLRNCVDCVFVIACGQLRTRDVKRCTISLLCAARPVIEASSDIKLCCFSARHQYFMLEHHMRRAKLSVFNNLYWFVHDFTPSGRPNFSFVPQTEFESSYDLAVMQMQSGGTYAATFSAVPVLSAGVPEYIPADEDMTMYTSMVAIPYTAGLHGRLDQIHPQATLRTLLVFPAVGLHEALSFVQSVELQRREYYALQGLGPLEQIVQLVATMEKLFTEDDVKQIRAVTNTRAFWASEVLPPAKPSGNSAAGHGGKISAVAHVADRDPKAVEAALECMIQDACVCVLVATVVENPPLLAVHRTVAAKTYRSTQQPMLTLDVTRPSSCESMMQLADLIFCKLPLAGNGFGGALAS